jgi:hypothetical protein
MVIGIPSMCSSLSYFVFIKIIFFNGVNHFHLLLNKFYCSFHFTILDPVTDHNIENYVQLFYAMADVNPTPTPTRTPLPSHSPPSPPSLPLPKHTYCNLLIINYSRGLNITAQTSYSLPGGVTLPFMMLIQNLRIWTK